MPFSLHNLPGSGPRPGPRETIALLAGLMFITAMGLIIFLVSLISGAPALIINAIYGNIFDPMNANPDAVPQILLVPAELLNIAAQALITPLYVAFQTSFYLDMRNRREGLDLLRQIETATATTVP